MADSKSIFNQFRFFRSVFVLFAGDVYRCVQVFANISSQAWNSTGVPTVAGNNKTEIVDLLARRKKRATGWAINWAQTVAGAAAAPAWPTENVNDSTAAGDEWISYHVPLKVNVKGCGYPPQVSCSEFHQLAGRVGSLLPCYPNQEGASMAVVIHEPETDEWIIMLLFVSPVSVFSASFILLCCMHNNCCRRKFTRIFSVRKLRDSPNHPLRLPRRGFGSSFERSSVK